MVIETGNTKLPSSKDDLPIGRDTEKILKEFIIVQRDIPKILRHTIVPIILNHLTLMISDVYFANAIKEERKFHLSNYISRLQSVKSLTRVLHESKAINVHHNVYLFKLYENVLHQAVKWKNYTR